MDLATIPDFAAGCRLHPTQDVLLIPEGTLRLSGPSRDILFRVDGRRAVSAIAADLLLAYPDADEAAMQSDILDLLDRLHRRGVLRIV